MKAPLLIISILITTAFSTSSPGYAKAPARETISSESLILKTGKSKDGRKLLQTLKKKFEHVKGYIFASTLVTYKKGKRIKQIGKFYFKSPNLVRFEVISSGRKSGSIVVRQPDGKIKGKAGGILGRFVVSLSPNSSILQSANGFNILKTDFGTLLKDTLKQIRPGKNCIATVKPYSLPKYGKADIIEVLNKNKKVEQRIIVSAKSRLPLEWVLFKNSKVYSDTSFSFLKYNNTISNDMFFLDKSNFLAKAKALHLPEDALTNPDPLYVDAEAEPKQLNLEMIDQTNQEIKSLRNHTKVLESFNTKVQKKIAGGDKRAVAISVDDRKVLFVLATKLEIKLDNLNNIAKKLEEFDQLSNPPNTLGEKWKSFSEQIRISTAEILEQLEEERVDCNSISTKAINIEQQTRRLNNLMVSAKSYF